MRFALFREVPKRQRRKKRKLNHGPAAQRGSDDAEGSDEESDVSGDDLDADTTAAERPSAPSAPAAQRSEDPIWGDDSQDVNMDVDSQQTLPPLAPPDKTQPQHERLVLTFGLPHCDSHKCVIDYSSSALAWRKSSQPKCKTKRRDF